MQLKHSRFVWLLAHIAPAVISDETFPALLVSEESSGSLKVPSALGREEKKKFEWDVFQAIPKNYMRVWMGGSTCRLSVVGCR